MTNTCAHCSQRPERGVSFGILALRCAECGALISAPGNAGAADIAIAAGSTVRVSCSAAHGVTCSIKTGGLFYGVLGVFFGGGMVTAACLNLLFLEGDQRIGTGYSVLVIVLFGAIAYAGLTEIFNRMTARIENRRFTLRSGPVPSLTPTPLSVDAIAHLRIVTVRARSGVTYTLEATRTDGKHQLLASSLARSADATAFTAIANAMVAAARG